MTKKKAVKRTKKKTTTGTTAKKRATKKSPNVSADIKVPISSTTALETGDVPF